MAIKLDVRQIFTRSTTKLIRDLFAVANLLVYPQSLVIMSTI